MYITFKFIISYPILYRTYLILYPILYRTLPYIVPYLILYPILYRTLSYIVPYLISYPTLYCTLPYIVPYLICCPIEHLILSYILYYLKNVWKCSTWTNTLDVMRQTLLETENQSKVTHNKLETKVKQHITMEILDIRCFTEVSWLNRYREKWRTIIYNSLSSPLLICLLNLYPSCESNPNLFLWSPTLYHQATVFHLQSLFG